MSNPIHSTSTFDKYQPTLQRFENSTKKGFAFSCYGVMGTTASGALSAIAALATRGRYMPSLRTHQVWVRSFTFSYVSMFATGSANIAANWALGSKNSPLASDSGSRAV